MIVNGLPGSGKTTLAMALGEALGWPVFSKDRVKETLADTLGPPPPGYAARQWSQMLGAAAGETLWTLLADARPGAVLESPYLARLRRVVVAGLERAGIGEVVEVWCDVPVSVARRRYETRAASRHAVHDDARVDDEQWREWAEQAVPLELGMVCRVDTTGSVELIDLIERMGLDGARLGRRLPAVPNHPGK
ncbi:AAA family ATPase [Phytoactinopolyspora sp. XMNu-373]|uniref:AAA family ATPase n=1 Tax=Phytoactinopolyspora mesophila TaxID=2650750 RepID=A0A7K3M9P0_9ACTN|nr:AAA family ATPase [Phytoactinopolyspora mesophila]